MLYEMVNELLEQFYKSFYVIEANSLKRGIKNLTTTELHVIEAISTETITMNELSERLGITMGTATVAVNKLLEKDFIERDRSGQDRRKVYVEVNVTHRPDGTARPNFIKFENDEKYEIDRVIQKCRAASTKVGGTGIRYTVQICGKPTFLFVEENGKGFVEGIS